MAGRKITQLPTLTTPSATDKLVIVDVSDTSESPQGTSKQIAVGDVLSSGSFTPTFSNDVNCTPDFLRALYSRVGNVVTVSYYLGIGLDATFTTGGFNISLPIPTNFSNARDAFGVITPITDPYSQLVSAITGADTATNEISFSIELDTAGDSLTFVANIQYIILP
jgi:hypothetical protein